MAQADLGHQPLEAGAVGRRGPGAAQVVIDHLHPLARPAELEGAPDQGVLQAC